MKPAPPKSMIVAGVMSGTSADGIDVSLCRISPATPAAGSPRVKVLHHQSFPFTPKLRAAILAAASATEDNSTSTAAIARLSWRLGEVYATCVESIVQQTNLKPQIISCHGQTIYHQGAPQKYLGTPLRCTCQIGEASVIAERLRLPVVSDFRPADIAAGGQGAPLVPMLDFCLFQHPTHNRLLLNLGGIANMTALPAGRTVNDVLAFDSGPANMIVDACMQRLYNRSYDKNGATAAQGKVLPNLFPTSKFFAAPPPKSCGREEFGLAFADKFLATCHQAGARKQDIIATATAFTVSTITDAYRTFLWPHFGQLAPLARATDLIVAGGGAKNPTLMLWLREAFAQFGIKLSTTEKSGIPIEAKEAAAFALLGWLTWHNLPGNIPSATGATRAVILGRITPA
jgi:anhydro-N-acetylmuramic acid kinase